MRFFFRPYPVIKDEFISPSFISRNIWQLGTFHNYMFDVNAEKKDDRYRMTIISSTALLIGAGIGFSIGGPIGAAIGAFIGIIIGLALSEKYNQYVFSKHVTLMSACRNLHESNRVTRKCARLLSNSIPR